MDIKETPTAYEIQAEMPGVKKEEATIEINDHVLTISCERKEETQKDTDSYHRIERFRGTASRSIRLPKDVDEEKVSAMYEHGVLYIQISKTPKAGARSVNIN